MSLHVEEITKMKEAKNARVHRVNGLLDIVKLFQEGKINEDDQIHYEDKFGFRELVINRYSDSIEVIRSDKGQIQQIAYCSNGTAFVCDSTINEQRLYKKWLQEAGLCD